MSIGERPGIYADYEVSGVSYSGKTSGTVGVCAAGGAEQELGEVFDITSYAAAVTKFGASAAITELVRILIKNGVSVIKAVPLGEEPSTEDYSAGFNKLCALEDVKSVICDSADAQVHGALKTAIESADERARHKIGVVEAHGTVQEMISAAGAINSERIVVAAPGALSESGDTAQTGSLAAAVAGVIACSSDPAAPLNGAELYGMGGVAQSFTDGDVTLLVRGGVTPAECLGGTVSLIRAVTSRTKTDGETDATFRELTTVMIIDDVLPTVRDALRTSFSRVKNNERTRGAIRTRVIVELEKKLSAEIIDGYDNVRVEQDGTDPTVCNVSFEFMVAHGLNQIRLTAHITV
ncbi:MAG: phage tail sheath C-terminal domain-containing protein [Oscillospiraceae bacterium]